MNIFSSRPRLISFDSILPAQFDNLLDSEQAEWKDTLGWDFRPIREIFGYMLSRHLLPGMAVLQGDRCTGYIFYLFRDRRCILGGFYFIPELRGTDWPRLLLERLWREPAFLPPPPAMEGQILFAGPETSLAGYLQANGFSFVPRWYMRKENLHGDRPALLPRTWERLTPGQVQPEELALLLSQCYRDHIDNQVSVLYGSPSGCSHLVSQIVQNQGCGTIDMEASLLVRIRERLAGGVLISMISPGNYYIPQIFVHPDHQGSGLGRHLLRHAESTLARREPAARLSLTVTAGNRLASSWYLRAGFSTVAHHYSFVRDTERPESTPEPDGSSGSTCP